MLAVELIESKTLRQLGDSAPPIAGADAQSRTERGQRVGGGLPHVCSIDSRSVELVEHEVLGADVPVAVPRIIRSAMRWARGGRSPRVPSGRLRGAVPSVRRGGRGARQFEPGDPDALAGQLVIICHTWQDVLDELTDVIITAAVAMCAIAGGEADQARGHFERRLDIVTARAGLRPGPG